MLYCSNEGQTEGALKRRKNDETRSTQFKPWVISKIQSFWQWIQCLSVTIQMKATEQYYTVVLFIMLYKVVLSFESVDQILKFDHSNESYCTVLYCGAVYYAVQGGSKF